MELSQSEHSAFSLPDQLDSIYNGIEFFNIQQMNPNSGILNNTIVGQGNASTTTTWQWNEDKLWWSPCTSYFYLKLRFVKITGGTPASPTISAIPIFDNTGTMVPGDLVTYADNFVSTFFTNIKTWLGNEPLESINQPWIIDQVLTYSNSRQNFLKTFGSLARVGETLNQRLINTFGSGDNSQGGVVEVCYRPPSALYDVKLVPPGCQHRIDFDWQSSAINAFESLIGSITVGTATGNYNIYIDNFSFYKATVLPSVMVGLPEHGLIDLCPCSINQYPINNSTNFQQNIVLPKTCNRIYIVFQDNNQTAPVTNQTTAISSPYIDTTGVKYMGVGTGWNPATSFTKSFSFSANPGTNPPYLVEISQLYINVTDLGLTLPKPYYTFQNNQTDWLRAYMDWAEQSQGTKWQIEGSVPFGKCVRTGTTAPLTFAGANTPGATIIAPAINVGGGAVQTYQVGNPENPQQLNLVTNSNFAFAAGSNLQSIYFQTSEYGWIARHPGPIFCFNICRPQNVKVSQGDVRVDFTPNGPISALMSVLCPHNKAIAVQRNQFGAYDFKVLDGH